MPSEAIESYLGRLNRAADCVGRTAGLVASPRPAEMVVGEPVGQVTFNRLPGQPVLGGPVTLRGTSGKRWLRLRMVQRFRFIELPEGNERGPFKVRTASYRYVIEDERELLA